MDAVVRLTRIESFGCDKCGSIFHTKARLLEHLKIHEHITSAYVLLTRENLLKCKTCSEGFDTIKKWKLHELTHMRLASKHTNNFAKPYKCEECDAEFVLKSTLVAHSVLHAPFPHLCHCGIGYYNAGDFRQHRRLVHPEEFQVVKRDRRKKVKPEGKLAEVDAFEDKPNVKSEIVPEDYIPKTSYAGPNMKNALPKIIKSESEPEYPSSDSEPAAEYDAPYSRHGPRPRLKATLAINPRKKASKKNKTKNNNNSVRQPLYLKDENGETVEIEKDVNKTFPCPRCDKVCQKRHQIIEHFKETHANQQYFCEICNTSFTKKWNYNVHLAKHSGKFTCKVCSKIFGTKRSLESHMVTHTNERPFSCSLCDKSFTQSGARDVHMKRHAGIKNIFCQYCKKGFYHRSSMLLHERTHTGEKPYSCSYCNKDFSDPSAFARHIRTHTGDKRYACTQCPMKFSDASGLIMHKRRHEGVKKFSCEICNYKGYDRNAVRKHVLSVHEALKNYQCHHCDKKFSLKPYLALHITSFHWKEVGLKKTKCRYCKLKFQSINSLRNHERTHKSLIHCDKCRRTFMSETNLQNHKLRGFCKLTKNKENHVSESDVSESDDSMSVDHEQ